MTLRVTPWYYLVDGNCGSDLFDDDDGCSVVEIVYVSSGCIVYVVMIMELVKEDDKD